MEQPTLSLIIPANNEHARILASLRGVAAFFEQQNYPYEVLLVDNASTDGTGKIAREFAANHPWLQVIDEPRKGKGNAVKTGMLAATGKYRMFADADFSMPVDQIPRFLPPLTPDPEIVIATREGKGAKRYNEPFMRHLSGRFFNLLVQFMALPGIHDSQCGFKLFRGDIAEDLFPLLTIGGWTFDVEALYIARQRKYRIAQIGVPWYYNGDSKVKMLTDSIAMFRDLRTIRANAKAGLYNRIVLE
ncbi:MAG TPA: glycosyltransferase family 2 protein [Bellilinea sp.]|nr:glycosyltransferase family 2 protein [Bellilinea sp.]